MATYEYNKKYAQKYMEGLDEVRVRMPKGQKDILKAHAEKCGESLNAFMLRAVALAMEQDKKSAE